PCPHTASRPAPGVMVPGPKPRKRAEPVQTQGGRVADAWFYPEDEVVAAREGEDLLRYPFDHVKSGPRLFMGCQVLTPRTGAPRWASWSVGIQRSFWCNGQSTFLSAGSSLQRK